MIKAQIAAAEYQGEKSNYRHVYRLQEMRCKNICAIESIE